MNVSGKVGNSFPAHLIFYSQKSSYICENLKTAMSEFTDNAVHSADELANYLLGLLQGENKFNSHE